MEPIYETLNTTLKNFTKDRMKNKNSLVPTTLDNSYSTKSFLTTTKSSLKPAISFKNMPTTARLLKSSSVYSLPASKLLFPKTCYKVSVSGLEFPARPQDIINSLPSLPEWTKRELAAYELIFFMSKNEKPLIDPSASESDGEIQVKIGDDIQYRYEVLGFLGKGTFGQVVKVLDHKEKKELALKIIKNKQRYLEQARLEIEILKFIRSHHGDLKAQIVTYESDFEFRGHFCIVFELLHICLYESIKKNNFRGLGIPYIKKIAYQTLKALSFLAVHEIIHCDLKPENILKASNKSNSIKLIDFGSSCFAKRQSFTYIQSRFYRAPEVVLGMSYSVAIDLWSFACILIELYTGMPVFPAESEKELVSCICEVIGEPKCCFLAAGTRSEIYFTDEGKLKPFKNSRGRRRYPATRPLRSILKGADEEFIYLVSSCLKWDPKERISAEDALKCEWVAEVIATPKVLTRYCKLSVEDIIKHTPKLKKFMSNNGNRAK